MTFAVSSTCSRKYRSRPSVISACISTGFSTALVVIESSASNLSFVFSPSDGGNHPTMASADFCYPIPTPHDGHTCRSANRSPCRVDSGFHHQVIRVPPRVSEQRQLRRYAPYLAHQTKKGPQNGALLCLKSPHPVAFKVFPRYPLMRFTNSSEIVDNTRVDHTTQWILQAADHPGKLR